jgi:hypothetical protein
MYGGRAREAIEQAIEKNMAKRSGDGLPDDYLRQRVLGRIQEELDSKCPGL